MRDHPDRLSVLLYVEGDDSVDRATIAQHVLSCAACREIVHEMQAIYRLVGDRDVHAHARTLDPDRESLRKTLLAEADGLAAERNAAQAVLRDLQEQPFEAWQDFFRHHPEHCTSGMARQILKEVEIELNRRPKVAMQLTEIAEFIGGGLYDTECRMVFGDVWKHRSNALRHLGRYEEALDAADIAEGFYVSLGSPFDAAQAQYTRAGTLFKMKRYADAMREVSAAMATLRPYGDTVPLARAMMLEAGIRIDQGDVSGAESLWREVLPLLVRFGDVVEQARVHANLAECYLRLGAYEQALSDAERAVRRYRELRMEAEGTRSEWTVAMVHLACGRSEEGVRRLRAAAAEFEACGMILDAGFVKLDLCEELLRRDEWEKAEITARELAGVFTAAHVTAASAEAVDFLRQAVERREATVETVQYVRTFVATDDASRPFSRPDAESN